MPELFFLLPGVLRLGNFSGVVNLLSTLAYCFRVPGNGCTVDASEALRPLG